jgi:hypothetical protein|tara:strand:+ start:460 stop:1125 length:666 start_codon:yes stop_codon:yes gene_type:complete
MIWPTLCIDDFFNDVEKVKDFARSLEYRPSKDGTWPGERTRALHEIDYNFFHYTTNKMIAALYPNDWPNMQWDALSSFQKINGTWKDEGWVHKDFGNEVTSIIYLDGDTNCGTSIFRQKTHSSFNEELLDIRRTVNKDNKRMSNKEYNQTRQQSNELFEKTMSFDSIPNRCVMFDACQYHGVNNYNNSEKKERLTLVTFFKTIKRGDDIQLKYHLNESRRI